MKQIKMIAVVLVALAALLLAPTVQAADDYGISTRPSPSGYSHSAWTTNTGPILVPAITLTNIPAAAAYILPVPSVGFGSFLRIGGSNTTTAVTNAGTNLVFTFEGVIFPTGSRSGGTQVVDNATLTIVTPNLNTTACSGYDYLTNYLSQSTLTQSEAVFRRCDGIRLRSIANTNTESLWVSNLFQLRSP